MFKRIIAMMLVLLMIIPMIASCGDDNDTAKEEQTYKKGNDKSVDTDDEYAEINAEIDAYIDGLATNNNYDGATFTYIGMGAQQPTKEEETGDIESDAFYYRQRDIEDKFGIDWNNYVPPEEAGAEIHPVIEAVNQDVLAGTHAYDLGYGIGPSSVQPLFVNNSLSDVSDYTTIDLDREWWTSALRDTFNINGAIYFLNGSIVSSHYNDTYCVLFNKQVANDYGIEDLYSLVTNNEWTFDKMIEIAEGVPSNENGSGAYRYGNPNGIAVLFAHGMTITKFDANGTPYVDENVSTELSDLADKFSAIFGDGTQTAHTKNKLSSGETIEEKYGYDNYPEMFADNTMFFLFATTAEAAWLRTEDVEFGILPMPKGSASQEDYVSYADPWTSYNVYVPKSTKDEQRTDVILEAMAALGYKYLKPANYDNILKSRSVYDRESKDMIDIIFATKKYDIIDMLAVGGSWNGDGGLVTYIKGAIQESSDNFSSNYLLQAMIVSSNIQSILAQIEADQ